MSLRRVGSVAVVGVAGLVLSGGALAWACTAQPRVVSTSLESGPPRSPVMVRGEAVAPAGPVELRWDGVRGPVIGTAMADEFRRFEANATIPDSEPGVHAIMVVSGDAGVGRIPFEVTPSSASTATAARSTSPWTAAKSASSGGSGTDGSLLIGAALLGVGAAALSGGAAVAALGRRRVPVGAGRAL
ncbi:MAG TPA: hypothetical protein VM142_02350 [Acidimicrobiales bacterium]|nr:hypothetical protein [Acidimicrobiales bacterium]